MTMHRLVQNFRNSRAWLWSATGPATDVLFTSLDSPLRKLGVTLERAAAPDLVGLDCNRDILLIDADGDLDPAQLFRPIGGALPPVPVVGLVGVEAPSRLAALVALGVTSFLRKPVHGAAVYSSLFLGINGYHRLRRMERSLAEHDGRRRGRRFVIKAVVHLVVNRGLSDDDAYALLRRESMRARQGIEEYCERFLQALAVPTTTNNEPGWDKSDATQIATDGGIGDNAGLAGGGRACSGPDQARRA